MKFEIGELARVVCKPSEAHGESAAYVGRVVTVVSGLEPFI